MAKGDDTLLWLLGLGAVGYYLYSKTATTTTTTTTLIGPTDTTGDGIATPVTAPAIVNPTNTIITAAVPTTPTVNASAVDLSGVTLPAGISQEVYNKVMSWAHSDGRPPVLTMAAALIPAEYNGMYNIITTQWATGMQATLLQKTFWDDLRAKYDPTHKYW
jgi:hypothetical protein